MGHEPIEGGGVAPEPFSSARVSAIFSTRARLDAMLRVEAAIAAAEADVGLVPEDAAAAIAAACDVDRFDLAAIERGAEEAGNAAIPLVRQLTDAVPEASRGWVHLGATSQDVLDSATMLQARDAIDAIVEELRATGVACSGLVRRHRDTVMPGRTLLQHAVPITFGLKAAHWLGLVTRELERLAELRASLPVQFGGAAGTLAALGADGPAVTERLATRLELAVPDLPWHTDRDRVARVAAELAIAAGAMAKVATDVALLMQTEVGEVTEGGPGGPSSAMPHKRNPVHAPAAIAAARLAAGAASVVLQGMAQEHERAVGGWQAEWVALPDAFRYAGGAVEHVRSIVEGLQVDEPKMRSDLEAGGGLLMAEALATTLQPHVGREEAFRLVAAASERARRDGVSLRRAVDDDLPIRSVLTPEAVASSLDPSASLGSSGAFADSALERFEQVAGETARA